MAGRLAEQPSFTRRLVDALANPWVLFGLGAQFMFMMRFLVQWIASERKQRSYVPVVFWYFSLGGGLMLSISPTADGTIPKEQRHILLELGRWLKINGQGIYGTRKWKIETEGPVDKFLSNTGKKVMWNFEGKGDAQDIRFTRKGNRLFAFVLDWPSHGRVQIKSLGTQTRVATQGLAAVRLLGYDGRLTWTRDRNGVKVRLPEKKSCDYALGLEIVISGELLR